MSTDEGEYMRLIREALGGQSAPASRSGGARILWKCPHCGRVWYQDGSKHVLDLTEAQYARLALELLQDASTLPGATCDQCAAQGVGLVEIDQYNQQGGLVGGYGVSVEGSKPVGMHFMAAVFSLAWTERLREGPRARPVTDFKTFRALIAWLEKLAFPITYHTITQEEGANMARMNPPGHRAPGTERFAWRGADWLAKCPPLGGGLARVTLAQAIPADEPFSLRLTFTNWQRLCRHIQAGNIAGEA